MPLTIVHCSSGQEVCMLKKMLCKPRRDAVPHYFASAQHTTTSAQLLVLGPLRRFCEQIRMYINNKFIFCLHQRNAPVHLVSCLSFLGLLGDLLSKSEYKQMAISIFCLQVGELYSSLDLLGDSVSKYACTSIISVSSVCRWGSCTPPVMGTRCTQDASQSPSI